MTRESYCPACGRMMSTRVCEGRKRPVCDREEGGCGYINYGRFTLGVGGIVLDRDRSGADRILLIQRNQEPNKGGWTLPGGFVEADETAEEAVIREVEEETGLRCRVIGLVGFRDRVDPENHATYAVFLLERIGGALRPGPGEEIAQAGFYTLSQIEGPIRPTPLSREVAVAALSGRLRPFPGRPVAGIQGRPSFTLFIG